MTLTVQTNGPIFAGNNRWPAALRGSAATDGTAFLNTTATATAASLNLTAPGSTAGFETNSTVFVDGATKKYFNLINTITSSFGLIDAVDQVSEAVTVYQLTLIYLPFVPREIRWVNLTNGQVDEWVEGLPNGTTLRQVAAGTRTIVSQPPSIWVAGQTFAVSPLIAPVNSNFVWFASTI